MIGQQTTAKSMLKSREAYIICSTLGGTERRISSNEAHGALLGR